MRTGYYSWTTPDLRQTVWHTVADSLLQAIDMSVGSVAASPYPRAMLVSSFVPRDTVVKPATASNSWWTITDTNTNGSGATTSGSFTIARSGGMAMFIIEGTAGGIAGTYARVLLGRTSPVASLTLLTTSGRLLSNPSPSGNDENRSFRFEETTSLGPGNYSFRMQIWQDSAVAAAAGGLAMLSAFNITTINHITDRIVIWLREMSG